MQIMFISVVAKYLGNKKQSRHRWFTVHSLINTIQQPVVRFDVSAGSDLEVDMRCYAQAFTSSSLSD
jgi:hypothetical protein